MRFIKLQILLAAVVTASVLPAVAPAHGSPAVVQEHVRHVTTVPGATGGHAVIEGDRLYVGAYGLGMRLFDLTDPYDPQPVGEFYPGPQPGQPDNDIGLRADAVPDAAVFDGRHIVTLNGTSRTAGAQQTEFVDWTDPADPQVLWRFTDSTNGEAHNGDIVDARRLWLPSGGGNGLRIYDLEPLLAEPPAAPTQLVMVNPVTLWLESPYRQDRPVGGNFSHIHDIEVYVDREVLLPEGQWVDSDGDGVADKTYAKRDIALLAEGGSYLSGNNSGSLFIVDITDPANPVALLRYQRPAGLGQPVRYVHEAQFLDGQPDILVTSDEDLHNGCDAGGVTIHRVSEDLTQIEELSQWFIGTGTPAAVCSSHVMSTKDDFLFFGGYNAGLQVVDLSDPTDPQRAGRYIAAGANSWGALVHPEVPGYLTYVGDFGARGLDVFEFTAPGVSDACAGRDIELAAGQQLVEHTVYLHGTSPSGNADAAQDTLDGRASRLYMAPAAPAGSDHKVFASPEYVVGPNPNFAQSALLGYWILPLEASARVVCAEAVVYAATADGQLGMQLWADAPWASADGIEASATGSSSPNQVAPYRVNFGTLDVVAGLDLLLQAQPNTPGSLMYYDSTSRPSWFTYVTVEAA
ncbi:MAG: hypothetical protein KY434_03365 [Actinobacteria bacterium]|nr:hypothetical protein [Actinomycetota bacterium]